MKLIFLAAVVLAIVASPAVAQTRINRDPYANSHWYALSEYGYTQVAGASLNGINFGLGWRPTRHFGIEIGDYLSQYSGATINSAYLDVIGLLPLTSKFSLFGSVGGSVASESADFSNFGTVSVSKGGWRAGGGFEMRLIQWINIRAAYHYQTALSDANEYTLGLVFRF